MKEYRALVAELDGGEIRASVQVLEQTPLEEGHVSIRVRFSGVNYKDGLAVHPKGRIVKQYPHIPGIDLAGIVEASRDSRFREGDSVLVTGYGLGVSANGGFAELAQVPGDWIVPLPEGLSPQEAMAIGTAGFTAALSVLRLEEAGLAPDQGSVLVAGATGGVGSMAVAMLKRRGYAVTASTRKAAAHGFLREIGASDIIAPQDLRMPDGRQLHAERWAAAVDPVGGEWLPHVLGTVRYGGGVALSGFTGGPGFAATVYPFILRGVQLLGIDSVLCPMPLRLRTWERLADELKPAGLLGQMTSEITLAELPDALHDILAGEAQGRVIVAL